MLFEIDYTKASQPATYKQYTYLIALGATMTDLRSKTQFMKRVNSWQASEAIDTLKNGEDVEFVFA